MAQDKDMSEDDPRLKLSTITMTSAGLQVSSDGIVDDMDSLCTGDHIGSYRVVKELGRGGMGVVYCCKDSRLGREVAVKVLNSARRWERRAIDQFVREAKVQAQTSHPGVVRIYHVFEWNGVLAAVMELVSGPTLAQLISDKKGLDEQGAITAACQVLEGLAHMHSLGLIHRDVSSRNIIWCERRGRFQLLDFGLAKPTEQTLELSLPGEVKGTPAFMSPEQARGGAVDARSDLFSVGVVLFLLLAGEFPHPVTNAVEVVEFLRSEDPFSLSTLNRIRNRRLRAIVQRSLSKLPSARYQSARQLLADLLPALGEDRPHNGGTPASAGETVQEATGGQERMEEPDADVGEPEDAKPLSWVFLLLAAMILIIVVVTALALMSD